MSPPMGQGVMTKTPIITFSNISFSFSKDQTLFKGLSFELKQGAFHLIAGPSGSGKSTLLRLINSLEEPLDGEILFKGRPPSSRAQVVYSSYSANSDRYQGHGLGKPCPALYL